VLNWAAVLAAVRPALLRKGRAGRLSHGVTRSPVSVLAALRWRESYFSYQPRTDRREKGCTRIEA